MLRPIVLFQLAIVASLVPPFIAAFFAFSLLPAGDAARALIIVVTGVWTALIILFATRAVTSLDAEKNRLVGENRRLRIDLEQAQAANQRFWSNISHELRTPLNSILGYSELLLDEDDIRAQASVSADLEKIRKAGVELLSMINNALTIAGFRSSASDEHAEPVNIQQLAHDVGAVIAPLAESRNNEFVIHGLDTPCTVYVDASKLERVLIGLLSNATRHVTGGRIVLDVYVRQEGDADILVVRILDTGGGLDDDNIQSIFQPFSSAFYDTEDSRTGSSGLGLAACKRMIDDMKGAVQVESKPGTGSVFTVRIPVTSTVTHAAEDPGHPPVSSLSVLVMDENEDAAELLFRHLKQLGCDVTVSNDGAAGKELATHVHPDVIIMDTEMVSISGWAVLQHLKFDSATRDIPVIICSGYDMRGHAFKQGAADYLSKPVSAATLSSSLARITGFRTPQQDALLEELTTS